MERQATMYYSARSTLATTPAGTPRQDRRVSDLVYQGMTIAAMLLLLGSLWAF